MTETVLDDFDAGGAPGPVAQDDLLTVRTEGFEGPLDLLLALARTQKVDLSKIQILPLAEQYLSFVRRARELRLELAADYLVMASWLAFLKSKLMLPTAPEDEDDVSGEDMAERLALRLKRLEAMREAAKALMSRNQLGQDVLARGAPESWGERRRFEWRATLFDLVRAYVKQRAKAATVQTYAPERPPIMSIEDARRVLIDLLRAAPEWRGLETLVGAHEPDDARRSPRSRFASFLVATLELVRDERAELRQMQLYDSIYVRPRTGE